MMLTCIVCKRSFDPEGWDPMGGDCPVVQDEQGRVISPEGDFDSLAAFMQSRAEPAPAVTSEETREEQQDI